MNTYWLLLLFLLLCCQHCILQTVASRCLSRGSMVLYNQVPGSTCLVKGTHSALLRVLCNRPPRLPKTSLCCRWHLARCFAAGFVGGTLERALLWGRSLGRGTSSALQSQSRATLLQTRQGSPRIPLQPLRKTHTHTHTHNTH